MKDCHLSKSEKDIFLGGHPTKTSDISVATPDACNKIYNLLFNTFSQLVILPERSFVDAAVFHCGYSKY